MPYTDVPERMLDGESVPRTEILGYNNMMPQLQTDLILAWMELCQIIERDIVAGVLCFKITPFGQEMRQDFVKRIDGDCPECPDCP